MAKTKDTAEAVRPYVKRAMEDPELREDLMAAFAAARELYEKVSKGDGVKGKAQKISSKDFQKELQRLVSDISNASDRIKGEKKGHKARNVVLLTGVTIGVLYNPWTGQATRDWIMERVAGGNGDGFEEFGDRIAASRPRCPATAASRIVRRAEVANANSGRATSEARAFAVARPACLEQVVSQFADANSCRAPPIGASGFRSGAGRQRFFERSGDEPTGRRDVVGLEQHRSGRR